MLGIFRRGASASVKVKSEDDVYSTIDRSFEKAARFLLFFAILFGFGLMMMDDWIVREELITSATWLVSMRMVSSILLNLIPLLLVAVLINPITERLSAFRHISRQELARDQVVKGVAKELAPTLELIQSDISETKALIGASNAVIGFHASFEELDWNRWLFGATEIDIAVMYWSQTWLDDNLDFFRTAAKNGAMIRLYLPSQENMASEGSKNINLDARTYKKVYETAARFLNACGDDKCTLHIVNYPISSMMVRLHFGSKHYFISSVFKSNYHSTAARPPVFIVDEDIAPVGLKKFVSGEFSALRSASALQSLDGEKFLQWSPAGDRVIVSLSNSCPMPCKFCYVSSLRGKPVNLNAEKKRFLAALLVYRIKLDYRFSARTAILLGGMTEPLHTINRDAFEAFFAAYDELDLDNKVHIASKFAELTESIEKILLRPKVFVSFSMSVAKSGIEEEASKIGVRAGTAGDLKRKGVNCSVYIRPVIPGRTVAELPSILKMLQPYGVKDFIVGGLYVDDRISMALRSSGVELSDDYEDKSFVMDEHGTLKKLKTSEIDQVIATVRAEGHTAYSSVMNYLEGVPIES